jgi:hypothetical protein
MSGVDVLGIGGDVGGRWRLAVGDAIANSAVGVFLKTLPGCADGSRQLARCGRLGGWPLWRQIGVIDVGSRIVVGAPAAHKAADRLLRRRHRW